MTPHTPISRGALVSAILTATNAATVRTPSTRTILMCRPEFFTASHN